MKRTSRNEGKVKIEDFQRETQAEFDRVVASSYGKGTQEQRGNELDNTNTLSQSCQMAYPGYDKIF